MVVHNILWYIERLFNTTPMNQAKILQLTLAVIKPHIIKQPHALQGIRDMILASDFKIVRSKRSCLSESEASKFYKEHHGKFFYNRLLTFMTSGPSELYILARISAISEWRKLMGATKVFKTQFSEPDTIRGLYGLSDTRNATHGSDSTESAEREIKIFFPNFNTESWYHNEEKFYKSNFLKFDSHEFVHIPVIEKEKIIQ